MTGLEQYLSVSSQNEHRLKILIYLSGHNQHRLKICSIGFEPQPAQA